MNKRIIISIIIALSAVFITSCNDDDKTFTVTFESGGSTVASQTVKEGERVTKPDDPVREGYTFVAWFRKEATTYEWNFNTGWVTANMTLYAKWGANDTAIDFNPQKGDVFVAGSITNAQGMRIAAVWKNGIAQRLTGRMRHAGASSVFVSGGDVYVAGYVFDSQTRRYNAVVWKNGVVQHLSSNNSRASSVFVSGDDVYVVGHDSNIATVWKNGVAKNLHTGGWSSGANSVFVSGNDVYVAGSVSDSPNRWNAVVWKNGVVQHLYLSSDNSRANSVFVSDGDVYVAGTRIWKNGELLYNISGNSIFVSGKDVYVVGTVWNSQTHSDNAVLWKNGIRQELTEGYGWSSANSIFVVE